MKNYKNVVILDHPLIRHKIALLRDKATGTKQFRELIEEITTLITFESFKEVKTKTVEVETPLEKCEQKVVVEGIEHMQVVLLDPMLATGGSACDAINLLKKRGCKDIKLMNIIGAPEGVKKVAEAHPDVNIYLSTLDRCLNENGYILPGLGDAGDRLFGTK